MKGGAGTLRDRCREREANGAVVREPLGFERVALGVGDLGNLQTVVQFEGRGGEIFECGEGDVRGGAEAVDRRVEVGADEIASDLELRLSWRGPDHDGEKTESEGCQGCRSKDSEGSGHAS